MTGTIAFTAGLATGAAIVWCWTMWREAAERRAIVKQFNDGWHRGEELTREIHRAVKRARRRMRQCASIDNARQREGLEPRLFYGRPTSDQDDNPESFI